MENLKTRIDLALETELAAIYTDLGISTGDIMPDQALQWEKLTDEMAQLFADLIQQNK